MKCQDMPYNQYIYYLFMTNKQSESTPLAYVQGSHASNHSQVLLIAS